MKLLFFGVAVLHPPGGMGVGAEGEAGVVVTQHTADGFYVHAVLEGQGGKGVPEVVKTDVGELCVFEDLFAEGNHGI